jgi:hypothetical protein
MELITAFKDHSDILDDRILHDHHCDNLISQLTPRVLEKLPVTQILSNFQKFYAKP